MTPFDFKTTLVTETSVKMRWNESAKSIILASISRYRVESRKSGSTWETKSSHINALAYTVSGLEECTTYQFRVSAYGDGSIAAARWSRPSNSISATTTCPPMIEVTIETSGGRVDGGARVPLDANVSARGVGALTYSWSGSGSFDNSSALDTTWMAPEAQSTDRSYTLTITVSYGNLSDSDSVTFTVQGEGDGTTSTPTVSFSTSAYSVDEGATSTINLRLSRASGQSLDIPITVSNGTAESGDYSVSGLSGGKLRFDSGDTSETFAIKAEQDTGCEDETVNLAFGTLPAGVGQGSPSTSRLTITDDDDCPTPTPAIAISGLTAFIGPEGSDSFTVTASNLLSTKTYSIQVTAHGHNVWFDRECSATSQDFNVGERSVSFAASLTLYTCADSTGLDIVSAILTDGAQRWRKNQEVAVLGKPAISASPRTGATIRLLPYNLASSDLYYKATLLKDGNPVAGQVARLPVATGIIAENDYFTPTAPGVYAVGIQACQDEQLTNCSSRIDSNSLTKLAAPDNLTISPLPSRQARLSWDRVGNREDYVVLRVSPPPAIGELESAFLVGDPYSTQDLSLDSVMSQPREVKYTVYASGNANEFLAGVRSPEITLIDNPIIRIDGNSKSVTTGPPSLRGHATLRWSKVSGVTAYTIRYRRLPGDHSRLNWRPQEGTTWQEITLNPNDIATDPEAGSRYMHPITGLELNSIYAVQLNYTKGSSEFFSVRDAYIWPAKDFPGEPGRLTGEPDHSGRVATYPFFGHWPDKTYTYSICANTFPPDSSAQWQGLVEDAAGQWESTTGLVQVQRNSNCVVDGDDQMSLVESLRNGVNEIFMYDFEDLKNAANFGNMPEEFLGCATNASTTACNIREFTGKPKWGHGPYARVPLQDGDIDIVINIDVDNRVKDVNNAKWTLQIPDSVRFNACGAKMGLRERQKHQVYVIMVHEIGHAFGLAGDIVPSGVSDQIAYETHHPGLPPTMALMAYDSNRPGPYIYQCSPHPFDILAINALYQAVGE